MKRTQSGVTLMELLIVVVIIGILTAIAYPSYRDQVRRANRTEAKVALEQIAQGLEKCFTRFMRYDDENDNCATARQFEGGGTFDTPDGHYRISGAIPTAGAVPATTYTLTATPLGGQTTDAECMNFTLNEAGRRDVSGSGTAARCW